MLDRCSTYVGPIFGSSADFTSFSKTRKNTSFQSKNAPQGKPKSYRSCFRITRAQNERLGTFGHKMQMTYSFLYSAEPQITFHSRFHSSTFFFPCNSLQVVPPTCASLESPWQKWYFWSRLSSLAFHTGWLCSQPSFHEVGGFELFEIHRCSNTKKIIVMCIYIFDQRPPWGLPFGMSMILSDLLSPNW